MAQKRNLPPPANQSQPGNVRLQVFKSENFSGPVPHPTILAKYNEAFPGCAERIVSMAERQAAHRHSLERQVVIAGTRNELLGSFFGLLIACGAIGCGTYLAILGKTTEGLSSIIGTLVALVAVFVYGKRSQKSELASKNLTMKE